MSLNKKKKGKDEAVYTEEMQMEEELFDNVTKKKKSKKRKTEEVNDDFCTDTVEAPVKKKKKKRAKEDTISDDKVDGAQESSGTTPKKSRKSNNKVNQDAGGQYHSQSNKQTNSQNTVAHASETIDWSQKDLTELIKRIEFILPEKDNLAFATRVEKLNWNNVAFKEYSGTDCKNTWLLVQKRLRRFRILSEVLQDAKEWISKPWTNFYRGNKTKRHPDMPRRPLSTYMIFYMKKKDKILQENPGMELTEASKIIAQMYKTMSENKRAKYVKLAADERKIYDEKLDQFYRLHPEIPRHLEKTTKSKPVEIGPKKPITPFALFHEGELKKQVDSKTDIDRVVFKDDCREEWKSMSDKKKIVWIDWAVEREAKYLNDVKMYKSQNPEFHPGTYKPILTKDEKLLKERLAGKPIKPPNSAYSLFSRKMLQSEEIKRVPAKDRMTAISVQWKNCDENEKRRYREHATHMMEQYKLDFATYLECLPEDKRQEELQNNLPKRRLKASENSERSEKNKTPQVANGIKNKKKSPVAATKIFKGEPEQPPVSGFVLFAREYKGKKPVMDAWEALSKTEKNKFEKAVQVSKQEYIKNYEVFLKSLTKKQLTEYSQMKRRSDENTHGNHAEEDEEEAVSVAVTDDPAETDSSSDSSYSSDSSKV